MTLVPYQLRVAPPHDYGPGRLAPCGHLLNRYHGPEDAPACYPCEYERARRRRETEEPEPAEGLTP